MRSREFSKLVASLPSLNLQQMQELSLQVGRISGRQEIQDLVSERIGRLGKCPHCDCSAFLKWGYTPSGEQRYRCKACSKSFTGLTGTPFAGTHNKAILLANADCMQKCLSVRQTAKVLGVHRNTALRFRQLMIPSLTLHQPSVLAGVAEADEAFFRKSYKGLKAGMPRTAYSRGSRAGKRGISSDQVAVLTAVARGASGSHITVLDSVPSASSIAAALAPVMSPDTVLCSDSASAYKAAAKSMNILLRQIPRGSHKLGPYHIQNVNALHSRIKNWFHTFRGVASKNLSAYLAWFRFFDHPAVAGDSRQFLLDAFGRPLADAI